VSILVE